MCVSVLMCVCFTCQCAPAIAHEESRGWFPRLGFLRVSAVSALHLSIGAPGLQGRTEAPGLYGLWVARQPLLTAEPFHLDSSFRFKLSKIGNWRLFFEDLT